MPLFTQNPRKLETQKIGCMQSYILWRCLVDRYITIDHCNHLKNFTHDKDFLVYLKKTIDDYKEECSQLENLLEKYNIPGPEPSVRDVKTAGNSEVVKDRETAEILYRSMRVDVMQLLHSFKDQFGNDKIREFIIKLAKQAINRIDGLIKYMKLKNWLFLPPLYPHTLSETTDVIATNEVFLLFDHLSFRYQNSRQTLLYSATTRQEDFALLLKAGIKVLEKEIKQIENLLLKFGITLPKRYSTIEPTFENKEMFEDKYMFNVILRGQKDALSLHGAMIGEVIVNDSLRKFFTELTFSEMNVIDKMTTYGEIRGWTMEEPIYRG